MPHYAVIYEYTGDPADRDAFRPQHRAYLAELARRGVNLISGPLGPVDTPGALFVVLADSSDEVSDAFAADPFQTAGVVGSVAVREWAPVTGSLLSSFGT